MAEHRIGTQEEWQAAARRAAEGGEGAHPPRRRAGPQAARAALGRRSRRTTGSRPRTGTKTLAELFDGRSQLLVYHFMFGPPYEAGCPVCSSIADTLDPQVAHLKARDTTLLLASRAPLEKLLAYRERMGWSIDWVSSGGSDFNRDLGFLRTEEELRPFLEGEIPPTVEQNARMCGTDAGRLRLRGAGPERVRALGRDRLPDLRDDRPRPRAGDGLLRPARPDAEGSRRERHPTRCGSAATTNTSE